MARTFSSPSVAFGSAFRVRSSYLAGLVLGLGAVAAVVSGALAGNPPSRFAFDLALPSILYFLAALAAFSRGRLVTKERQGWWFLALSGLLVGLGGLLRMAAPGTGSWPFGIMLLGGALQGVAILVWPHAPESVYERVNKAMDGLVFALALFFILWILGWGQIFQGSTQDLAKRMLILAFPLIPTVVLGIAIYSAASHPVRYFRGPLGWIVLGVSLVFIGNLAWGILTLKGTYGAGNHGLDALSFFIPLCRLAAPLSLQGMEAASDTDPQDHHPLAILLPYFPVLPALALGIWFLNRFGQRWDPVPPWIGIIMVILLLVRQYRAIRQQHRISESLEQRVLARTKDLEDSQDIILQVQRMNTISSLGAGLAHDLNNILGSAKLYAALAGEDVAAGKVPKARDLDRIQAAINRAADLTSSLMGIGRQEPSRSERFDLASEIRQEEHLLQALLPRNIELEVRIGDSPLPIQGQPSQWTQILVNLVSNARDAMPAGGRVLVRLEAVPGNFALLAVEDNGVGMSPEVQARVFDPFFTTKAPGKGTGLGLASVRILVANAEGELDLWSEVGCGSRFSIRVPLALQASH